MAIATINPTTGEMVRSFRAHSSEEVESRLAQAPFGLEVLRTSSFVQRAA